MKKEYQSEFRVYQSHTDSCISNMIQCTVQCHIRHCTSISISMLLRYTRNITIIIMLSPVRLPCLLRSCTCLLASDLQHNQLEPSNLSSSVLQAEAGAASLRWQTHRNGLPRAKTTDPVMSRQSGLRAASGQHTRTCHVTPFHDSSLDLSTQR